MFANTPLDDDYFGTWPASAAVLDASVDVGSGVVTVDLTGLEWTSVRLPAPDGRLVAEVGPAPAARLHRDRGSVEDHDRRHVLGNRRCPTPRRRRAGRHAVGRRHHPAA